MRSPGGYFGVRKDFIERSIIGTISFFKDSVFSEGYAVQKGFLQSIDPRVKTFSCFVLVVTILFIKRIPLILCLYLLCLLLAYLSKINLGFFLKRTWVFIPLFSLFIAIPAIFTTFTPGEPLFSFSILGLQLVISRQGLFGSSLFVSRVITSVSWVILLSLVTRNTELLRVLRIFRIPQTFVMILGMTYRYIYLFAEIIENTYLAMKSRVGSNLRYKGGRRIVGWNIATLWYRSVQLNEYVYSAMLSRGFTGEPRVWKDFITRPRDGFFLACVILFCAALLFINYG